MTSKKQINFCVFSAIFSILVTLCFQSLSAKEDDPFHRCVKNTSRYEAAVFGVQGTKYVQFVADPAISACLPLIQNKQVQGDKRNAVLSTLARAYISKKNFKTALFYSIQGDYKNYAPLMERIAYIGRKSKVTDLTKDQIAGLYLLSAEKGFPPAAYSLGWSFEFGRFTPINIAQAVKWYEVAAQFGHDKALNALGVMYTNGKGVPKNPYIALELFRKSAKAGSAKGRKNAQIIAQNLSRGAGGSYGSGPSSYDCFSAHAFGGWNVAGAIGC